MSDYDRGKFHSKKKFSSQRDSSTSTGRGYFGSKYSRYDKEGNSDSTKIKQPTILIKAREPTDEVSASPKRTQKEDVSNPITIVPSVANKEHDVNPVVKQMTKSTKLLDDGFVYSDVLQDFVQENSDFLVIGVVGSQGVGKSTILNLLAQNHITAEIKKSIFKSHYKTNAKNDVQNIKLLTNHNEQELINLNSGEVFQVETSEDAESNLNATQGIDAFITANRTILLDCQPFTSVAVLDDLIEYENKRTNLVSEFIPLENSGEIQGLQFTSFLMSVCHVLIVVQDWFFDSNIPRFIQSAEMLKPTISNPEDELIDNFPHLLLVHNKAQMEDFSPSRFKTMQDIYKLAFNKTKLHIDSNIGIGSGRIIKSLNTENCGSPINLYLIPEFDPKHDLIYKGHPPFEEIIKRLRANVLGATKNPLTHVQLTEKTWLVYCSRVWDNVRKSSFFVEYTKLMP